MQLLLGHDEAVARWVAGLIPFVGDRGFGPNRSVGVIDGRGALICGVVFHDWQPQFRTMAFSIASVTPRWARPEIIGQLFAYPFMQANIDKLWTATPSGNARALKLCKHVGMTQEATLYRHFGSENAIINRMMRKDFVRLYGHGKAITTPAA